MANQTWHAKYVMFISNIKHDLVVVRSQELFTTFSIELHSETGWSTCTRCTEAGAVVITGPPPPQGTQRPHPLPGDRRRVSPYTGFAAQMGWLTLVITLTKALHRVSTLTCSGDTPCSPSQGIPCKGKILPTPLKPPRTQ